MKNQNSKILFLFFFADFTIGFLSCRDDIYDPNSLQGNKNEPCITSRYNSYTFTLDGQNFDYDIIDYTSLKEFQSFLDVKVSNYSAGYVIMTISDSNIYRLYRRSFNNNTYILFDTLTGFIPERIALSFRRFTGSFRFAVYNNNYYKN